MLSTNTPGRLTARAGVIASGRASRTWANTLPPELCAAIAAAKTSMSAGSSREVRLPCGSAAVPRTSAKSTLNGLYQSSSLPPSWITSTSSSVARALPRPPPWGGAGEGVESDVRDQPVAPRTDLAQQRLDGAGRQCVGIDLVFARQLLHASGPGPVAADHALDHALVREAADACGGAVADAQAMDEREIAWMASGKKALLDGLGDVVGFLQSSTRSAQHHDRAIEHFVCHGCCIGPHCLLHSVLLFRA